MLAQPVKLLLAVGLVTVVGASFLSQKFDAKVSAAPTASHSSIKTPSAAPAQRSWYSSWFEGMSFRTGSTSEKPVQKPVKTLRKSKAVGFGSVMIAADRGGQFNSTVEIDGQLVPMLVDTGATVVELAWEI